MPHTTYTHDELLTDHPYDEPLALDGVPCHGGFVGGRYVSPRTLHRAPAIAAWQAQLPEGTLAAILGPIDSRIPPHFPNVEQTKLLVRHGVTVPLVRILSLIAMIEGFGGQVLRMLPIPDFGERVREPIDGTALAHLGSLFEAHALDEAGHRHMWELARDIALDRPEIPADLVPNLPPPGAVRVLPEVPGDMEGLLLRMLGVLSIEVFAVEAFRWARAVLGDAALFPRHVDAERVVAYIQQDEAPHVGYLAAGLGELRCRTLMGSDGALLPGQQVVDKALAMVVGVQTGARHQANCAFRMQVIERCLAEHPRRDAILDEFAALGPRPQTA